MEACLSQNRNVERLFNVYRWVLFRGMLTEQEESSESGSEALPELLLSSVSLSTSTSSKLRTREQRLRASHFRAEGRISSTLTWPPPLGSESLLIITFLVSRFTLRRQGRPRDTGCWYIHVSMVRGSLSSRHDDGRKLVKVTGSVRRGGYRTDSWIYHHFIWLLSGRVIPHLPPPLMELTL